MSVKVDYSRIDGALALACDETPEDERSLTVFVRTNSPPDPEQVRKLTTAGVNVPSGERKIFTATLSPACLRWTNARAADLAFASDEPDIERELSMAITRLFASPRLTASRPTTGAPFSVR